MQKLIAAAALSFMTLVGGIAQATTFQLGIRLDVTRHSFLAQEGTTRGSPWSIEGVAETVDSGFNVYTVYGVANLTWTEGVSYAFADIRIEPTLRDIFSGLSIGQPVTRVTGGTNRTGFKVWYDEDRQERALGVTLFERHLVAEVLSFQDSNFDPPGDDPELSLEWQRKHFTPGTQLDWLFEGFRWTSQDAERYASDVAGARYRGIATIQSVTTVPEPASWVLMIGGFGLAGGAIRRRKRAWPILA